jgi:amino acid adenylation domain-containing protein
VSSSFVHFAKAEVEQTIVQRFEKQVTRFPDRLAIQADGHALSYAEFNSLVNGWAESIVASCGEQGEGAVAFLLERGVFEIAALLATLKAGRMCVPLDASVPPARLGFMLHDSQARLLLADEANLALARQVAPATCSVIETTHWDRNRSETKWRATRSPDSLAYLLYTSGSTGLPKGVVQPDRNVLHYIMNYTNGLGISPQDRLSLLPSCAFSAAMMDIFAAMLNGAALYPYNLRRDGLAKLASWLRENAITVYHSVPSVFRHFVRTLRGDSRFDRLRVIDLGGEPVYRSDVDYYRARFSPNCRLVNGLGCTELNVIRQYHVGRDTEIDGPLVPVGYPVEDTTVLLLDDSLQEVATGAVGELAIQSRYLSPGYWRRPDLTEHAFTSVPDAGGERRYLTGDLARLLPDGCLVHLGRKDSQVKVRGHRIELAEVEGQLLTHPLVREAIVVPRGDRAGGMGLVAYLVGETQRHATVADMRSFLNLNLPQFMIPAAFVWLDHFPLLPNGKPDRQSLPPPENRRPDFDDTYALPRTSIEKRLTAIWQSLLKMEKVGICDDFFDLGGDSLLGLQLFSEIERIFAKRLPLRTLLESATISKLARLIAGEDEHRQLPLLVELQPHGLQPPLFTLPSVTGDLVFFKELIRLLGPEQPVFGLQPGWNHGIAMPDTRLEDMATTYAHVIQSAYPRGPYRLLGYSFGGKVAKAVAQRLAAEGGVVDLLAIIDTGPVRWRSHSCQSIRAACARFLANLPYWIWDDLLHSDPRRLLARVNKRVHTICRRLWGNCNQRSSEGPRMEDIYDVDRLPAWLRATMAVYFDAWKRYQLQRYPGRVALFRARAQPLFRCDPYDLGWGDIADKGVDVVVIPGNHESLVREPNVRVLAAKLLAVLKQSQPSAERANAVGLAPAALDDFGNP